MSDDINIYDKVLISLRKIARAIDLHSKQLEKSSGLSVPQLIILRELIKEKELPVGDLAKRISLSHATVTSIINRLEKRGYIKRVKSIIDKRMVYVSYTELGFETIKKVPNLLQEKFITDFAKLKEWEQTLLLSSIQRIAAMMDVNNIDDTSYYAAINDEKLKSDENPIIL